MKWVGKDWVNILNFQFGDRNDSCPREGHPANYDPARLASPFLMVQDQKENPNNDGKVQGSQTDQLGSQAHSFSF